MKKKKIAPENNEDLTPDVPQDEEPLPKETEDDLSSLTKPEKKLALALGMGKAEEPEPDSKEIEKAKVAAEKEAKKKKDKEEKEDKARIAMLEMFRKKLNLDADELMSACDMIENVATISTGHSSVDQILTPDIWEKEGRGGVPRGILCEFFGPHAGGKSSLCLMLAATVTRNGGRVLWIDAENSFVRTWAALHGVDLKYMDKLDAKAGKFGEEFMVQLEQMAASGYYQLCVVDSISGLNPKALAQMDLLDKEARIGAMARMLSLTLPRIIGAAKTGNCSVIFINQIRQKIGISYGNPETTPGGESLKFFASMRVRLNQIGSKKERGISLNGEEIGIRSNIEVVKNRFGPPFRETVLPIYYGDRRPLPLDLMLDVALEHKIIKCRTKKDEDEQPVQYFTLEGYTSLTQVKTFGDFRDRLEPEHLKEIYKRLCDTGMGVDPGIAAYIKDLDAPDPVGLLFKKD